VYLSTGYTDLFNLFLPFVPCFSHSVLQIDSSQKQSQSLVFEVKLSARRVGAARPGEPSLLQALAQHPQSSAVPEQYFQTVASFVGEDEQTAFQGVFLQLFGGYCVEPVEALAHIDRFDRQIDPDGGGKAQHAFSSRIHWATSLRLKPDPSSHSMPFGRRTRRATALLEAAAVTSTRLTRGDSRPNHRFKVA
jgi:hypothetical protein